MHYNALTTVLQDPAKSNPRNEDKAGKAQEKTNRRPIRKACQSSEPREEGVAYHQVPIGQGLVHSCHIEESGVIDTGRNGGLFTSLSGVVALFKRAPYSDLVGRRIALLGSKLVESSAERGDQWSEAFSLVGIRGILKVEIALKYRSISESYSAEKCVHPI
jgi:hypothetical protein